MKTINKVLLAIVTLILTSLAVVGFATIGLAVIGAAFATLVCLSGVVMWKTHKHRFAHTQG